MRSFLPDSLCISVMCPDFQAGMRVFFSFFLFLIVPTVSRRAVSPLLVQVLWEADTKMELNVQGFYKGRCICEKK